MLYQLRPNSLTYKETKYIFKCYNETLLMSTPGAEDIVSAEYIINQLIYRRVQRNILDGQNDT